MSNSMYSNIESDDIFASAMEEAEIVENPFLEGDGEPLDAVDAAKRLLGDDADDGNDGNFSFASNNSSKGAGGGGGNSLLERIQQQKKQQNSNNNSNTQPVHTEQPAQTQSTSQTTDSQFGYPMVEEGMYSSSNANINIPEYSQVPSPSPYNTDSPYNPHNSSAPTDYRGQMLSVLSTVGSAASVVAKSAYQGTKTLYGKMTKNQQNNSGLSNLSGGGGNMAEMDYQRESLLMDPHDLEASGMSTMFSASSTTPTSGMRAGVIRHNEESGNTFLSYAKTFAVDMKDLFLGASRRVQIGVVALFVLIIYLLFFE